MKLANLHLSLPCKREDLNITWNERRDITTDVTDIQKIIRDYYEPLCINKLDNLKEMDKLLEAYNLPTTKSELWTKNPE